MSFNAGSAGGPTGPRPQHVKDALSPSANEAGNNLLSHLTDLHKFVVDRQQPCVHEACRLQCYTHLFGQEMWRNTPDRNWRHFAKTHFQMHFTAHPRKIQRLFLGFSARSWCLTRE